MLETIKIIYLIFAHDCVKELLAGREIQFEFVISGVCKSIDRLPGVVRRFLLLRRPTGNPAAAPPVGWSKHLPPSSGGAGQ